MGPVIYSLATPVYCIDSTKPYPSYVEAGNTSKYPLSSVVKKSTSAIKITVDAQ